MNDKIIGIIGGMGPEATANFYLKIIKATKAGKDQEHFRVIIDSNPKVPDRTEAILGRGESPVEGLVQAAKNLELLGVDTACIPCITSHYFIEEVQSRVNYPIINALEEVRKHMLSLYPEGTKTGILATDGTIKTGLFQKYLDHSQVIYPSPFSQTEKVMKAIYGEKGIKRGNTRGEPLQLLVEAAGELMEKGADVLIMGCTEIGLVLRPRHIPKPLIDPMEVMARAVVRWGENGQWVSGTEHRTPFI